MQRTWLVGCLFLLLGAISMSLLAQGHARPRERIAPGYLRGEESESVSLYQRVLPTVVTISTLRQVLTQDGTGFEIGLGSGVLISPDCHILTAAHVVAGAEEITVRTFDGELRSAELVLLESSADIALLRLSEPDKELAHAVLGDSDRLAVGQKAYVVDVSSSRRNFLVPEAN